MKFLPTSFLMFFFFLAGNPGYAQHAIPCLKKQGTATQLHVHNKPMLILGGELGNSSAASLSYLNSLWPTLEQMQLNTLLVPVYWELIEPNENIFDFSLVDSILVQARKRNLHLVLLWFGAYKNSMSCYAPGWVKSDYKRFPRAKNKNNEAVEILSPMSKNNLEADKKAFVTLMQHIKQVDEIEQTVLMIQVENEIGMLPDARDYSDEANTIFAGQVPRDLMNYLHNNKKTLHPELYKNWHQNGEKNKGTWTEVFGSTKSTEELFMAWYYARFTQQITEAGKKVYPLPMFVNAALNRVGYAPGEYPSAGPLPHLMDVWKAGAPAIDMLSPDIYFPEFEYWVKQYATPNNPLFIPEARFEPNVWAKMFYAMGNFDCLGFNPFSIESTNNPANESIVKAYKLMHQLTPLILKQQGKGKMHGVIVSKEKPADTIELGGFTLHVKHDYTLGWSPEAKNETWPMAGGIIIYESNDTFYIAGSGLVLNFLPKPEKQMQTGILSTEKGYFDAAGKWNATHRLNGDQTHQGRHVRIPMNEFTIQKFTLYQYH